MDNLRPPELTGANYAYWKARTKMYLKAQGERVWRSVLTEWVHPTKPETIEGSSRVLKPEEEWTETEITTANYNSKALNTIFASMHEDQFTLIAGCTTAKSAWDILETTYEGTASVKQSKLQLVHSEFENLHMKEEESIVDFHARIQDLANRASVLGESFPQTKLVTKILRSLPQRFRMKVTAIQENAGWEDRTVAQLMGSLQTYELEILNGHNRKEKNVAFAAEEYDPESDPDEHDDDPVVLLTKQFSKFLKQVKQRNNSRNGRPPNQKGSTSVPNKVLSRNGSTINRNTSTRSSQPKDGFFNNNSKTSGKGIRCYECEGYGHVQSECPTYLRRKKSMTVQTWSDDESELICPESDTEQISGNFVAFTAVAGSESETEDFQSTEDKELPPLTIEQEHAKLLSKWEILLKVNRTMASQIQLLENTQEQHKRLISEKDIQIQDGLVREERLKQELNTLKRQIKMMDTTSTLDQILDSGRKSTTKYGLGFTGDKVQNSTVFVKASVAETDVPESSTARQAQFTVRQYRNNLKVYNPVCHYCRLRGHTRPECYYFYKDQRREKFKFKRITPFVKQVWVKKDDFVWSNQGKLAV